MKMKTWVILLLGILFSLANAQTQPDSTKIFKTNSLQFKVYNFISLSSFKGTLFSYKFHLNDQTAYRLGVSVRARKGDEEETRDVFHSDTSMFYQNSDNNYITMSIMIEYLKYFNPQDEIKLFLGIGPLLSFNISSMNNNDVSVLGNTQDYYKKSQNERYQVGLTINCGLEWFFKKNMSLHAEYGFNAYYYFEESSGTRIIVDPNYPNANNYYSNKRSGFRLNDAGGLLGLSVYF